MRMGKDFEKKQLVKKSENFSQWYTDVILKAGLAEYAPIRGCQILKPYGFAVWENIQNCLDEKIKKMGVKNVYFPIFIPESFLKKEKEHVKGFSPELTVVTIGGGKKLKEKLVVRPTSETIICKTFAKWVKSWRDLPVLVNQWCNIVRWEKRPRLLLRTTEFLWQEGHTLHETHKEALKQVKDALNAYIETYRDLLGIDGISGEKSEAEKFPGAEKTFSYEMLMPDGKALQGATSHDLGQNFAKVFNIKFKNRKGEEEMPWQTSWGLSTRSVGALVMVHGDDAGLILPPKVAPIQVIIIPIFKKKGDRKALKQKAEQIKKILRNFRVEIDLREEYSPGWKFNEWELKGVPLRIEIGEKEIKNKKATLVRRDNRKKELIPFSRLKKETEEMLGAIQKSLFQKSRKYLKSNITEVSNYKDFKEIMKTEKGLLKVFWCGDPKCEARIKRETKATVRCLSNDASNKKGKCVCCGKESSKKWIFGQAY